MSKVSLTNLVNLQNETTAVNAINANNAVLTTALDNTLSRDGTTPNTMGASLDMNSHRIINLVNPVSTSEPVNLAYLNSVLAGGNQSSGLITGVPVSSAMQPVVNASTLASAFALLTAGQAIYRPTLTADRTYFVATTGSNSNDGLTSGTPFLTIAKALSVASSLDLNSFSLTIKLADGTYSAPVVLPPYFGRGTQGHTTPVITGNAVTPSNVVLSGGITGTETNFEWVIQNLKVQSAGGNAVNADVGTWIVLDNVVFGASTNHMVSSGGIIEIISNYSIVGDFSNHILINSEGRLLLTQAITITIVGTPAMSGTFATISTNSTAVWPFLLTFTGSLTGGTKYLVNFGGGSTTGGNGMNYFPGASAGTLTSPGWIQ